MTQLTSLISTYDFATVVAAVGLYIVLRSEFHFRYPRPGKKE